jgi:hypothetical protein
LLHSLLHKILGSKNKMILLVLLTGIKACYFVFEKFCPTKRSINFAFFSIHLTGNAYLFFNLKIGWQPVLFKGRSQIYFDVTATKPHKISLHNCIGMQERLDRLISVHFCLHKWKWNFLKCWTRAHRSHLVVEFVRKCVPNWNSWFAISYFKCLSYCS